MTIINGICDYCSKPFAVEGRNGKRRNGFCNRQCYFAYKKLHGPKPNCKCKWCEKIFHLKPSAIKNGEGIYCSRECKHISQRIGIDAGKESYSDRHLIRQSSQYRTWRTKAKLLKGNKCEKCGVEEKSKCDCCGTIIYLHVHHIKPFSSFPELRFDPKNASVLCPKCHLI